MQIVLTQGQKSEKRFRLGERGTINPLSEKLAMRAHFSHVAEAAANKRALRLSERERDFKALPTS